MGGMVKWVKQTNRRRQPMRVNMRKLMNQPGMKTALRESVLRPVDNIQIALPWPPSVNTYWRHVGPRVLVSAKGREYQKEVAATVLAHGMRMKPGRYSVTIWAYPPDRRRRDIDNLHKSLLDSLVKAGVIEDDEMIDDLRIVRCEMQQLGRVVVRINHYQVQVDEPSSAASPEQTP
jgi:crossover junction endodeoxyribonuclease RusA